MTRGKLGPNEPNFWKLLSRIRHVLAAKHAEPEHLARREIGLELRIEIAADGSAPHVAVAFLHSIIHDDGAFAHFDFRGRSSASLECLCGFRRCAPTVARSQRLLPGWHLGATMPRCGSRPPRPCFSLARSDAGEAPSCRAPSWLAASSLHTSLADVNARPTFNGAGVSMALNRRRLRQSPCRAEIR
jgi:hypothetical protein